MRRALTTPELRDPRGYIIPADQPDFGTATRFVNILMKAGITIWRASAPFTVAGKSYPANSYVVKTAQAFRPHVMVAFFSGTPRDDQLHTCSNAGPTMRTRWPSFLRQR